MVVSANAVPTYSILPPTPSIRLHISRSESTNLLDLKAEVAQRVGSAVGESHVPNRFTRTSINDNRYTHNLGSGLFECLDRGQHTAARRRGVLHRHHSAARHIGTFDPALQSVCLLRLPHHEGIELPSSGRGRVQHRRRDWVRAQGQAANRVEVPVRSEIEHYPTNERSGRMVQRYAA